MRHPTTSGRGIAALFICGCNIHLFLKLGNRMLQEELNTIPYLLKLFLLFDAFAGHGDEDDWDDIRRLDLSGSFDNPF